jgi:hypothetical protein
LSRLASRRFRFPFHSAGLSPDLRFLAFAASRIRSIRPRRRDAVSALSVQIGRNMSVQIGRNTLRTSSVVITSRVLARSWAANPRGGAEFAAVRDLISEYEIRGFEFPGTEIAPYFEVVMRTARELFATRVYEKKRELGDAIMDRWESARTRQQ